MKLNLKAKTFLALFFSIGIVGATSIVAADLIVRNAIRGQYTERTISASKTVSAMINKDYFVFVRDKTLEIYNSIPKEERVINEEWGSEEWEEYMDKLSAAHITDLPEYKSLVEQCRVLRESTISNCVYLSYVDVENDVCIYIIDSAEEDICLPGSFDPLTELDHESMKNPDQGFLPEMTNTPEYGYLITTGSPIYKDNQIIGMACCDVDMNDVIATEKTYILIISLVVSGLAIFFILLSYFLVDNLIVKPIKVLSNTAQDYVSASDTDAKFDKFSKLNIHTRDEIEVLSDSMKKMECDINDHIDLLINTKVELDSTREYAKEMDRIAYIDSLTKVGNKRAFDVEVDRLTKEIENGTANFALAVLDVNNLKVINDTYGHEKGDVHIIGLAELAKEIFSTSIVCRVGGDEFVVIIEKEDLEHVEELEERFNRYIANINEDTSIDKSNKISAAIGIAKFDIKKHKDIKSVFRKADEIMYNRKFKMKHGGK